MNPRRQAHQGSIILQYDKRRYDGGSEIELIEYMEAQRNASLELTESELQSVTQPEVLEGRAKKFWEALLIGPMELAVGTLGVLTTLLAIATFSRVKNLEMVAQSKAVLKECARTFVNGITHTLTGPGKALKVAISG